MPRKVYGSYKTETCPYCGITATAKNKIGIPVCVKHIGTDSLDIKCVCGSWLDPKDGKYGFFFLCEKCGPVSFARVMEMKGMMKEEPKIESPKTQTTEKEHDDNKPKEIFITTNDVEYFS
jgi:hypothetical protein